LLSNENGVKCLQFLIIRSWCIPWLGLLLDALNFDDLGTKTEACETTLATKIVALFKVGDGLVKIVVRNGLELLKKIQK